MGPGIHFCGRIRMKDKESKNNTLVEANKTLLLQNEFLERELSQVKKEQGDHIRNEYIEKLNALESGNIMFQERAVASLTFLKASTLKNILSD